MKQRQLPDEIVLSDAQVRDVIERATRVVPERNGITVADLRQIATSRDWTTSSGTPDSELVQPADGDAWPLRRLIPAAERPFDRGVRTPPFGRSHTVMSLRTW